MSLNLVETAPGRTIGIRHRTKMTVEEEARPTEVVIIDNSGSHVVYKLEDEQAELDFLLCQFPISFRVVTLEDDLTDVPDRHLKLKAVGEDEEIDSKPSHRRVISKKFFVAVKVADAFDGLSAGDTVAMTLGGSGDYFAFALARRGEEIGAKVVRLPAFVVKQKRGEDSKDNDAELIAKLAIEQRHLFYDLRTRDKEIILIREAFRARIDAMKERIACEQRLRQRFIGSTFCNPQGHFAEGAIEKLYDNKKANDVIYQALLKEERARELELEKLVKASAVWKAVFAEIEGMGWAIASRIIAGVTDIRRFRSKAAFKAFCGVHVLPDGRFARRRSGSQSNWHPDLRQALYLMGDQMNRRPDSKWGEKLLYYKTLMRIRHPDVVIGTTGAKKYTKGHIHKMAMWRTITKFAEQLFKNWKNFEKDVIAAEQRAAA